MSMKAAFVAAGLLALAIASNAASAGPITMAGHRAVYDLVLDDAGAANSMADVSGRLVMEFSGSECAGYTSKLRFVTAMEDGDGGQQVTDSRSSTFEAADGSRLEFNNETYTDDALAETSRGEADRHDRQIAIALTKPAAKKFSLPANVVFPSEQMERIIASAVKGETFLHLDVYDGSENGETVFETAGVIGRPSTATDEASPENAVVTAAGIAGMRHWPLTISYFDKSRGGDDTPFYVMSFVIYENGIGRTLKIDYGNFALVGTLTRLDMLPPAPCPKK